MMEDFNFEARPNNLQTDLFSVVIILSMLISWMPTEFVVLFLL